MSASSPAGQQPGNPDRPGGFYIPSLDGIRAISFLIVFLAHAGLERWVPGYLGLTFFFFLSGYLITTLLRREADRTGKINVRDFYLRRVFRIFPPFYLVLALALLLTWAGVLKGPESLRGAWYQVFHLTNYYIIRAGWWEGIAPGTWVYWSLAVEEHFYLLFPFLYLWLRRKCRSSQSQALVLLLLCALVLGWRCWLVFAAHAPKDRLYVATDTRVDSILFGCVLALWGNPVLDRRAVVERAWKYGWFPAGLLVLGVSVLLQDPRYAQTLRYTLQGLALIPIFVAAVRFPDWGPFRILNHRWVRFLGVLSYSLYLLHTAVIFGVRQWIAGPPLLQGVLSLLVSFLLALVIYHGVELPTGRLRKRLSSGKQRSTDPATSPGAGGVMPVPVAAERGHWYEPLPDGRTERTGADGDPDHLLGADRGSDVLPAALRE